MTHYTGATARASLADARRLGPRWVLQEKHDGMYCRLYLDSRGRVARGFARSGLEVNPRWLDGIRGEVVGWPHAELVGELEASTESACAAVESRGQRLVHLFDCLHDGRRSLVREPYRARRDALWRMQSEAECYGKAAPWLVDAEGDAHDRRTGRYTAPRLTGWRVAPIVEQAPLTRLEALWDDVVREGDREGLVAVNLDAPAGARNAKLKIKPWESIDAAVVAAAPTTIVCTWNGHPFTVGRTRAADSVAPGDVVEVRHAGWYAGGVMPRFPTLVRVRRDLH